MHAIKFKIKIGFIGVKLLTLCLFHIGKNNNLFYLSQIYMNADLTKGVFGHSSTFQAIQIYEIFDMLLYLCQTALIL